ncbi:MAG TPA: alpha-mannosidase [Clostridiales bacterium]|nr:alpha-mannosidase [Clostridiales bacterium]
MIYRKERVQVIADNLRKLSRVQQIDITDWKIKKGTYNTIEEVDSAAEPWQDFDSRTMQWTGKDEHYWFRTKVRVPESFEGKPLYFIFKTQIEDWDDGKNPQFLAFVNGEIVQGLDMNHRDIFITDSARAGQEYTIDLQAYTGILYSNFLMIGQMVEIDKRIMSLYYDLQVPLWITDNLQKDDLTRIALEQALENTINLLDLRQPYSSRFYESVDEAAEYISNKLYQELAGREDIVATCVGHTHIDVAWWWTVAQTREKVARSFATVLKYMDEYPEYIFMSSQPQLYKFLKQRYPEMYEKLKQRVAEGRWEPEGGMWVEADCNVTSGESLVRQFMHGKKFFRDEFGVDNVILWLPDVFGYSAALPQIMKKSGIKYFMTTKISWNQFNKLPYDTFFWRGIDGTEIFTHLITTTGVDQPKDSFFTTYNGILHPSALSGAWDRYQQKELNNDILISYGHGDGGGGPTRQMLETGVRMQKGIMGAPKVRLGNTRDYFDKLYARCADNPRLPKWVGELYLEYHRGTYTSMARNKRSNRKCELGLQDLEFFSVWAENLGIEYPREEIFNMWETVLLNQFHDILPGTSVKEVYDVTKQEYEQVESRIDELISERVEAIAKKLNGDVTLFNTLSFDRDDIVVLDNKDLNANVLVDDQGNTVTLQKTHDDKLIGYAKQLPAKGLKVYKADTREVETSSPFVIKDDGIETPFYSIKMCKGGVFHSLFDKRNSREVLKGAGNVLKVYEDKPMYYDNWDIDIYYSEKAYPMDDLRRAEWLETGPVRATYLVEYAFSGSLIRQKIHFYADSPRIDFETYADWHEHQHLLKVEFDVDVNANEASYDIQFGNLKRPTHRNTSWDVARFEVCAHKWADLSEGDYGVSLLNDCKYGHAIHDGKMAISLVKSGIEPNPVTDQEEHFFTYSILPHKGDWKKGETVKQAYMLNVPVYSYCNLSKQEGRNPAWEESILEVLGENVILETVKKAEDGEGIVVRLYEYQNQRGNITIKWNASLKSVYECDLLENNIKDIDAADKAFSFEIMPYEIKTFRIIT